MTIAKLALDFYEARLKAQMERDHPGAFLAIEPQSQSHFLGETFVEAALAARKAFPERRSFVLRIGQEAAFHLGAGST